jgi:hypothetical protein
MKPTVHLYRMARGDQGTQGVLIYGGNRFHTLELPWRYNKKNISCIPQGTYPCNIRVSPKFGKVYWVKNVPDRDFILIHSGNWAGDTRKGFKTNVYGCILLGLNRGLLLGQTAVLNSRLAIRYFMETMEGKPFTLMVHDQMKEVKTND